MDNQSNWVHYVVLIHADEGSRQVVLYTVASIIGFRQWLG